MASRSIFLRLSVVGFVITLLALASLGTQNVRAGIPLQATVDSSATLDVATTTPNPADGNTANATVDTSATATDAATEAATVAPLATIGGDEAYPPCPMLAVPTAAATVTETPAAMSGTDTGAATGATADAAASATATADAMAGMDMGGAATATESATQSATDAATAAVPVPAATTDAAANASSDAGAGTPVSTAAAPAVNPTPAVQMGPFRSVDGCTVTATLSGANEVPNPGDPDGTGTATLTITRPESGTGEICFQIETTNLTLPAQAAHIHAGPAGIAGPVVVPLGAPDESGKSSGCVSGVDRSLIKTILLYADSYYVNVHTSDFPDGAVRGQLASSNP